MKKTKNLEKKSYFVVSLGGSLVVPETVDVNFLKKFKKFILNWLKRGQKFIIVVGGGRTCRNYQKWAQELKILNSKQLDNIGIRATHLNAELIKGLFLKEAYEEVLTNPFKPIKTKKKIIVAGGYRPGNSTDYVAVLLAKFYQAKKVINLSNIKYLYDKDPQKYPDAKKIEKIKFNEVLKISGNKWQPGLNFPIDPKASQLAQKEKIAFVLIDGKDFKNLNNFLLGKKFKGTLVEP